MKPEVLPTRRHTCVGAILASAMIGVGALSQSTDSLAQGVSDDFNDGNDAGWSRYEPLAGFGAGGVYGFPAGGYRIAAGGSPAPGLVGPGRAGSFRLDTTLGDFTLSFDLVDWGSTPFFAGAFARLSDPGLASTDGYALGYDFSVNRLFISVVANEAVTKVVVSSDPVVLDPAKDYRLRFDGIGSELSGRIAEIGTGNVLATVVGSDGTYASGAVGLGAVVQSETPLVGAEATFDNFVAAVPEPSAVTLLAVGGGLLMRSRRRSR